LYITTAPEAIPGAFFAIATSRTSPALQTSAPTSRARRVAVGEASATFARCAGASFRPGQDPRAFTLVVNARGETGNEKPGVPQRMKRRRCLFPADGFYEWRQEGRAKRRSCAGERRRTIAFAGLWEIWMGPTARRWRPPASSPRSRQSHASPRSMSACGGDPRRSISALARCVNVDAEMATALIVPARRRLEAYESLRRR